MKITSKFTQYLLAFLGLASIAQVGHATPLATNQRNFAIILDMDDIEGKEKSINLTQADLAHQICANDACILASASTFQRMINAAHGMDIEKGDSLIEDAQRAYKLLDSFTLYSDGFLWLLMPKNLAAAYEDSIDAKAAGLTPATKPKAAKLEAMPVNGSLYTYLCSKTAPLVSCLKGCFKKNDHAWNIYIRGHGDGHGRICGMADAGLKSVMDFFATEVNTRTFVFSSCYGGGQVTNYLFPSGTTYPYLILCQGLGENVLYGVTMQDASPIFKKVSAITDTNNLNDVINCLPRGAELADQDAHRVFNSYQIRLPNSDSFVAPELRDAADKIITQTITDSATNEALRNASGRDLILDTNYVSGTLHLGKSVDLYTRLKGHAWHYIQTIDASTMDKAAFIKKLDTFVRQNDDVQRILMAEKVLLKDSVLTNFGAFINYPDIDKHNLEGSGSLITFYQKGETGYLQTATRELEISHEESQGLIARLAETKALIQQGLQPNRFRDRYAQGTLPFVGLADLFMALVLCLHFWGTIRLQFRRPEKLAA